MPINHRQLRLLRRIPALLALLLVAAACGTSQSTTPQPGAGAALLIDSRSTVGAVTLGESPELGRTLVTGGSVLPVFNQADGYLYFARHDLSASLFTVQAYDPSTLEPVAAPVEWPKTSLSTAMTGLAFSPDGTYAASVIRQGGDTHLQLVSLEGSEPVELFRGFQEATGDTLVWLDDTHLAISMDVSGITDEPVADFDGAIVAIDVLEAIATTDINPEVITGYVSGGRFDPDSVTGLTLSPDGSQLMYSLGGNVWIKEAPFLITSPAPHQLTDGAIPHFGAVFSPDGSEVALVEYHETFQSGIFVIPNHRGPAMDPGSNESEYLIIRTNARGVLGWLP